VQKPAAQLGASQAARELRLLPQSTRDNKLTAEIGSSSLAPRPVLPKNRPPLGIASHPLPSLTRWAPKVEGET